MRGVDTKQNRFELCLVPLSLHSLEQVQNMTRINSYLRFGRFLLNPVTSALLNMTLKKRVGLKRSTCEKEQHPFTFLNQSYGERRETNESAKPR